MAEHFYTILTEIGKASIANASALGTKVDFKYMALGDGNGSYYNPNEKQTELKKEVYRSQINHVQIDSENDNWITLSTIIPANIGGFTVREVGAFDVDGNLLVIGKVPETYKPKLEDGSSKDLTINMILEVSNASVVNLKIDPSVILATKKELDDRLKTKVDKVEGKGLSENDFTNELKEKLGGMAEGANKYIHPLTHPPEIIEQDLNNRFISALELAQIENNKRDIALVKDDLGSHLEESVSRENGVHDFRIKDKKPQIKNTETGEWENVRVGTEFKVGNVSNISVSVDDASLTIRWTDPNNLVVKIDGTDVTFAEWKGTQLRYSTATYPSDENQGTLVVDSTARNQYKDKGFTIESLENDVEVYLSLFPYTTNDVFTVDSANRISGTPSEMDDTSGSPGPVDLTSGTMDLGFFGEVPASAFITGDNLASQCGISQGTSQHSNTPWLKFAIDGEIIFVAKKPIRNSISWDAINTARCVYGGDKQVAVGGLNYQVTLLKGANDKFNPKVPILGQSEGGDGYSKEVNHGSEWNRLMCAIHEQVSDKSWAYKDNVEEDLIALAHNLGNGVNGGYNDSDLLTHNTHGNGSYSWCQEMSTAASNRLYRGNGGVSNSSLDTSSNANTSRGWRPALRFVP